MLIQGPKVHLTTHWPCPLEERWRPSELPQCGEGSHGNLIVQEPNVLEHSCHPRLPLSLREVLSLLWSPYSSLAQGNTVWESLHSECRISPNYSAELVETSQIF